jgi:acyl-CoA reductase-like NAD-dependent aldehyde dehydrogenase
LSWARLLKKLAVRRFVLSSLRRAPPLTAFVSSVPDGVLSILPGYGLITGKALIEDPRIKKVDLTGGTVGGRIIGSIVGKNLASYTAELGGKAPIIIFGG